MEVHPRPSCGNEARRSRQLADPCPSLADREAMYQRRRRMGMAGTLTASTAASSRDKTSRLPMGVLCQTRTSTSKDRTATQTSICTNLGMRRPAVTSSPSNRDKSGCRRGSSKGRTRSCLTVRLRGMRRGIAYCRRRRRETTRIVSSCASLGPAQCLCQ